ncbi:MAG: hypothetical protein Q8L48_12625 [Archangium sp.]|nr:hypothetical protein [Archangium sp.]
MNLKLMISALMLCSSLAFAGDLSTAPAPTTAPKKKMMKVLEPAAGSSAAQHPDDGVALGGLGTGASTAKPKKLVRGSAPEPRK